MNFKVIKAVLSIFKGTSTCLLGYTINIFCMRAMCLILVSKHFVSHAFQFGLSKKVLLRIFSLNGKHAQWGVSYSFN